MLEEETFISYLIPILRYHSRYDELSKEDKELREMMLSNNKKKLLQKIRDEALKKKKTKVKVNKNTHKEKEKNKENE